MQISRKVDSSRHLGGIEILIKPCFREGIDTPIEIYLADDRIIQPIEKSIISAVKGNLIYQKFKFIISANYSVAINDRNIDKSLVLYWKMSGIELDYLYHVFLSNNYDKKPL